MTLNERAWKISDEMASRTADLGIAVQTLSTGVRVLDCGVSAPGGLQAGLMLARLCLADLGEVAFTPGEAGGIACPVVQIHTDHPITACLASQYAGWQIKAGKFFAMGSGPMRAALGNEKLFDDIPGKESSPVAVGVLESRQLPDDGVATYLSEKLKLAGKNITLAVAPTASLAGSIQVVARSVETALHKLHELKFDLSQIQAGFGSAPLPPIAKDDLTAIGRTNDAILYGGRVVLWVRSDDAVVEGIGRKTPSSASPDHGAPFKEIFARHGNDFYKLDPHLFSPAEVVFVNMSSGKTHVFGRVEPEILKQSFLTA